MKVSNGDKVLFESEQTGVVVGEVEIIDGWEPQDGYVPVYASGQSMAIPNKEIELINSER